MRRTARAYQVAEETEDYPENLQDPEDMVVDTEEAGVEWEVEPYQEEEETSTNDSGKD